MLGKYSNIWKLHNTLLKNHDQFFKIKENLWVQVKQYLDRNLEH